MEIIEGDPIEGKAWRALVLLEPGQELDIGWVFGHHLARANGQLISAVLLPTREESLIAQARETLALARNVCVEQLTHHTLILHAPDARRALPELVQSADIDLVISRADARETHDFSRVPCAVAVLRGQAYSKPAVVEDPETERPQPASIDRILLPTAGGPNTIDSLSFLLPLTNRTEITALFVATDYLSVDADTVGAARLRQVLQFADATERVEAKTRVSWSATAGIVAEANEDYDLVILGASRESSLDRALFGNVVDSVVRQSRKPVIVVREGNGTLGNLGSRLAWRVQRIFPRKTMSDRVQIYTRLRRNARADTDYFTLIALSAGIAAFGLLLNSPAVIIGAMLVAPLMSPIVGVGLAIVQGDGRFLRLAVGAVLRGAMWATVVGFVIGLIRPDDPLTAEVLSRTAPTLLDLGVALLAGMAGAYALCESDAAGALPGVAIAAALVPPLASAGIALAAFLFGPARAQLGLGALLLFSTNFIAITSAAVFVFLALGFRPNVTRKERRDLQIRTVRIALVMLAIVSALLAVITYGLAQEDALEAQVREVTAVRVAELPDVELQELIIGNLEENVLNLELTVRSTEPDALDFRAVVALQEQIGTDLQREVALELVIIDVTRLDPFRPPTLTPTATATAPPTPGPAPTPSSTPTGTPTTEPSPTPSPSSSPSSSPTPPPTATDTLQPTATPSPVPTATIVPSPTPRLAVVVSPFGLNLRATPGIDGALLALLEPGAQVVLLEETETVDGDIWLAVASGDLQGWVLGAFLETPAPAIDTDLP